ncbi:PREDICTED: zinc finger CCHC domain-containing protein 8 [Thamnophis sirtalis]|uniref:Zinc finger CCHC domain-containing protein 8 n=1 Tax=Thamnophis sirtalis TaxID=35019 RepID=A0A6I9XJ24_9SAUR|nr:PREDICTED: zinc finger CCHC domain-containing protein 8 [Thamnophis sirtalis]
MAAEVDFGDRELFQQLEADEEAPGLEPDPAEEASELRERLRESEETIRQLREENQELRRKLNNLARPSGLTVDDCRLDGPLLQILFMNNDVSKQYHQEVEDFVSSLVQKYEEQRRSELDKACFNVKPQPSSFVLEEDHKITSSNVSKKIKEAFSVVGSVLYFTNFCLDKLGQPILNENPQLTDGWEIPKYQQVFTQILSLEGQEIQVKSKSMSSSASSEGEEESHQQNPCVSYDLSKLINYPGFNMSTPSGVTDEWRMFGSVPLQPSQQKEIFAHYLSTYHSANLKSKPKRPPPRQSSHHSKRQKGSSAEVSPADMEIDSDLEMPPSFPDYDGFHFQPPLPPGSPLTATPPPLPQGTPPATPPSLTPPQPLSYVPAALPWTPSAPRPEDSAMDEDTLTLEELEEQQRLIWAALEQAESGNSDSDLPAGTPMASNSGTSSPCRTELSIALEQAGPQQLKEVSKAEPTDKPEQIPQTPEEPPEEPGPQPAIELVDLTAEREAIPTDLGGQTCSSSDPGGLLNHSDAPEIPSASQPPPSTPPGLVPDMSKFAAGITPFEYDNLSESTGTYLRIRSALKKYPRSQLKNKKLSL